MKGKRAAYIEFLNIYSGETELQLNPTPSKGIIKAAHAWQTYASKRRERLTKRALDILEIYEKARKFDEINKKKTFWQKIKGLVHA